MAMSQTIGMRSQTIGMRANEVPSMTARQRLIVVLLLGANFMFIQNRDTHRFLGTAACTDYHKIGCDPIGN